jgi:hypothetical protein
VFVTLPRPKLAILVPGGTSTFREFPKRRNDDLVSLLEELTMVSKALYGDGKLHVARKQSLDNPLVQIMTWYNGSRPKLGRYRQPRSP